MNNTYIREDGATVIAEDFQTPGGKKLSNSNTGPTTASQIDSQSATNGQVMTADGAGGASFQDAGGGGGTAQSPLKGNSKALVNNTDNALFSFPLADGEYAHFFISLSCLAKKGADWATGTANGDILIYNSGGTLHTKINNAGISDSDSNSGSVSLAAIAGVFPISISINTGIVTAAVNPGNVGTLPDSIVADFTIQISTNNTITLL